MGDINNDPKRGGRGFMCIATELLRVIGLGMVFNPSVEVLTRAIGEALRDVGGISAAVRERTENELVRGKLAIAIGALQDASTYMGTLDRQIGERESNLQTAKATHEHYQQLAGVEKTRADAFIKEMAERINEGAKRERKWAFVINIVAGVIVFVLGVVLSDTVTATWKSIAARF